MSRKRPREDSVVDAPGADEALLLEGASADRNLFELQVDLKDGLHTWQLTILQTIDDIMWSSTGLERIEQEYFTAAIAHSMHTMSMSIMGVLYGEPAQVAELLSARRVDYAGADADAVADIIRRLEKVLRAQAEHRVDEAPPRVTNFLQQLGLPQVCLHACTPPQSCMHASLCAQACFVHDPHAFFWHSFPHDFLSNASAGMKGFFPQQAVLASLQSSCCAAAEAAALLPAGKGVSSGQLGSASDGPAGHCRGHCSGGAQSMLRREGPAERALLCAAHAVAG